MRDSKITRRTFLKGASAVTLAAVSGIGLEKTFAASFPAEILVPNSSGTGVPRLKAPANACDCHHHIYDDRFPFTGSSKRAQTNGRVEDYRLLQRRIGTTRNIVVNPSAYGTNNDCTVDALSQFGPDTTRGIAVVDTSVSDAELQRLDAAGIRGIRFTLFDPATSVTSVDMIEPLAKRVSDLGWHLQIHMRGDQLVAAEDMLNRLTVPIVFDHIARLPQPEGTDHPAFAIICRLLDNGRTWVKLSGAYQDTKVGPPTYADITKVAQSFVKYAPERMVWGSDWPHPTEKQKPDDAILFDLLAEWAPDQKTVHRILVDNPAALYGFPK
ncbi:MAG: amidohydrolase family protein [Negativicutes bacterium]|nr:amidohydrolase family protein [Negativicutes bacterium]